MSKLLKPQQPNYTRDSYEKFHVYSLDDKYSFFHINIADTPAFYEGMYDYFFTEERLLKYIENKSYLTFSPTSINFVSLYKHLGIYIDSENDEREIKSFEKDILEILKEEYQLKENKIGNLTIRLDKIGRMGEYIFNSILWDYFKFDCIIPKVHLTTDSNMSVYGIDSLFYSSQDNFLLFGESKLTNSIDNGVKLIKESLKEYEKQIAEEYNLVLSNRFYKKNLNKFNDIFGDLVERCININDFIAEAKIQKIGVPIFIAHGQENDIDVIFDKLHGIHKKQLFKLVTNYFLISVPILNKGKLIATFTKKIREKRDWYEQQSRKQG